MKHRALKWISAFLACLLTAGSCTAAAQKGSMPLEAPRESISYEEYLGASGETGGGSPILLTAADAAAQEGAELREDYQGREGKSLYTQEGSRVTFAFRAEAGSYRIRLTYYPEEGRASYAKRSFLINGEIPFAQAEDVALPFSYADKEGVKRDLAGNDVRPEQAFSPRWLTADVYDGRQYESMPLAFRLEEGENTLTILASSQAVTLACVQLVPAGNYPAYEAGTRSGGEVRDVLDIYQAEAPAYKSDPTLYPVSDNNPSTVPHEDFLVRLNEISAGRWNKAGQSLTYQFEVQKSGYYQIALKTRQNSRKGLFSSRRLSLDGQVPFQEANSIRFPYTAKWQQTVMGGDTPWQFWLEAGVHELRLEAVLGDMGPILEEVGGIVEALNTVYRDILVITGTTPDVNRDYDLAGMIPDTLESMAAQSARLKEIYQKIFAYTGQKGGDFAIFDTLTQQLDSFAEDPDRIPSGYNFFKTNIGSLGTWLSDAKSQPLDFDYFTVYTGDRELPPANTGFFTSLRSSVASFVGSFVTDYNSIGNLTEGSGEPVKVWLTTGRDQMQILKSILQDSFVQQEGVNVQLELVNQAAVLPSVVAGIAPDVVLNMGQADPVNYALRNALYDLRQFADIEEITARFPEQTLIPFTLNGGLYALPETITMPVLFYRTDVLRQLGLELPQTWQDVISMVSVLQQNNMTFGIPVDALSLPSTYYTLIYQNGGEMYTQDGKACLLSENQNVAAFKKLTNFFKNYSLEQQYDFKNRFRTGEMPIAMADLSSYNSLVVSAPEIDGLWGMALLPGTMDGNGSLNRTAYLSTTSSFILRQSKQPEEAWKFLKWWSSTETQSRFSKEMESLMGASARYLSANREAFARLAWTDGELEVLKEQMSYGKSVPEVPGGYYVSRYLNNALRAVVIQKKDLKDTLDKYEKAINNELTKKRKEFGML